MPMISRKALFRIVTKMEERKSTRPDGIPDALPLPPTKARLEEPDFVALRVYFFSSSVFFSPLISSFLPSFIQ